MITEKLACGECGCDSHVLHLITNQSYNGSGSRTSSLTTIKKSCRGRIELDTVMAPTYNRMT